MLRSVESSVSKRHECAVAGQSCTSDRIATEHWEHSERRDAGDAQTRCRVGSRFDSQDELHSCHVTTLERQLSALRLLCTSHLQSVLFDVILPRPAHSSFCHHVVSLDRHRGGVAAALAGHC